jgi:nucleotide-binding universal stress UspA family protein
MLAYGGSAPGQQALLSCRDAHCRKAKKNSYQTTLDTGVRKLADAGLAAHGELVMGDAVHEIAHCARRIGAGHKHLDGWATRWWRGSVSKALIEHAPCSVLVVITH